MARKEKKTGPPSEASSKKAEIEMVPVGASSNNMVEETMNTDHIDVSSNSDIIFDKNNGNTIISNDSVRKTKSGTDIIRIEGSHLMDGVVPDEDTAESSTLGDNDNFLQKILRSYGAMVSRHPWAVMGITLLIYAIFIIVGFGSGEIMNKAPLEKQWSKTGGKVEEAVDLYFGTKWKEGETDFASDTLVTMFIDKNSKDNDVATRAHFMEMFDILTEMTRLKVTVNNSTGSPLEYDWWDLCSRGPAPDSLPVVPYMPCLVVSAFSCFSEYQEVNHISYRKIDPPNLAKFLPNDIPFSTRPSFKFSNDTEIKFHLSQKLTAPAGLPSVVQADGAPGVSRGCFGKDGLSTFVADLFMGMPTWGSSAFVDCPNGLNGVPRGAANPTCKCQDPTKASCPAENGSILTKVKGLRFLTYTAGPFYVNYRMSKDPQKQSHRELATIRKAVRAMAIRYHDMTLGYNSIAKHIKVASMPPFYTDDFTEVLESDPLIFLIAGFVLNFFFCCYVLVSYSHPQASRATVGLTGLFLIVVSEAAAIGFYCMIGGKLNGPMMLVVPILGLGIGLDDMFVLIRYFSSLGNAFMRLHDPDEILGEALSKAGVGTTLTSLCNAISFFCGVFLPLPGISDLCLGFSIMAIINYVTNINLLLLMLAFEIDRIKEGRADPHPLTYFCHKRIIEEAKISNRKSVTATSTAEFSKSFEKQWQAWLQSTYAEVMTNAIVCFVVTVVAIVGTLLCVGFINNLTIGWSPNEFVPEWHYLYNALEWAFSTFSVFPFELLIKDIDVAGNQREIIKLHDQFLANAYVTAIVPNTLTMFYLTMAQAQASVTMAGQTALLNDPATAHLSETGKAFGAWLASGGHMVEPYANLTATPPVYLGGGNYPTGDPTHIMAPDHPQHAAMLAAITPVATQAVGALIYGDMAKNWGFDLPPHLSGGTMNGYNHTQLAPHGLMHVNDSVAFYEVYDWWRKIPEPENFSFDPAALLWVYADAGQANSHYYQNTTLDSGPYRFCFNPNNPYLGYNLFISESEEAAAVAASGIGMTQILAAGNILNVVTMPDNEKAAALQFAKTGLTPIVRTGVTHTQAAAMGIPMPTNTTYLQQLGLIANEFETHLLPDGTCCSPGLLHGTPKLPNVGRPYVCRAPEGGMQSTIDIWSSQMLNIGLDKEDRFIDMIASINKVIEASPLSKKAYQYGPITIFWAVFLDLEELLATLLIVMVAVVFVLTFLFMEFDIVTALITAACCEMIVLQVYGIVCVMMNFNVFVAAFILMTMGMSVEFTCHLAAAFSTGHGDGKERLGEAMAHTFPALLEGVLSTALGIFPVVFHEITFNVKYMFVIVMIVLATGTFNGFVMMPGMLGLLDHIVVAIVGRKKSGKVKPVEDE